MAYLLGLEEVDRTQVAVVGGKAAQLGELSRLDGIRVPDGVCVTTDAFRRFMAQAPSIADPLARLSAVSPADREAIGARSAEIRDTLQATAVPDDVAAAIAGGLDRFGDQAPCAVRSSATAEDLPTASFAGQQDSYLNVVGAVTILEDVRRCWASLFTERAVAYRLRNGFDHRRVQMAVIVQRMVAPQAAGVLFTADPVSSDRRLARVEATSGLGEALVSGLVNPETFTVRDGEVVTKSALAQPLLTDAQAVRLVTLGRRIEAHFGVPQDIEWCLTQNDLWIVQSRPITTLFPAPAAADDEYHVYVSVGHGQMMTDAMRPLGVSMWQLTAMAPMHEAAGRLFVDVTRRLASPATREGLLQALGQGDPLIGDALRTLVDRGDLLDSAPVEVPSMPPAGTVPAEIETDPAIVAELIERSRVSIDALRRDIRTTSGPELFDLLLEAFVEHKRLLSDPLSIQAIMAGMQATWWLNEQLEAWLGEKNAADALTLSAPGNVTAEMGLALLDVADVIRPHPGAVALLERVAVGGSEDGAFLDELAEVPGGRDAREALGAYLEIYGMRCVGEIDITRPRWSERPATLVPMILDNVRNFTAAEAARRLEQGRQHALDTEQELLARLRRLPDGAAKAAEAKRMIDRVRTFAGYREYPKYAIVSRYFLYKQALMEEADRLVQAGVLADREDVFFLRFGELRDAVTTRRVDPQLIRRRRDAFRVHQALAPPRVLTSDGEAVAGTYRRDDLPAGALIGVPVSGGTVEGRARVIRDVGQADLHGDDILVTTATDPGWTPLFPALKGLVTEVGGLMTHGAVIAREYGLPAVVGVQDATRLIEDGQRIRLNGTDGYVEVLSEPAA